METGYLGPAQRLSFGRRDSSGFEDLLEFTAVYPGVAHRPACRNQPLMSLEVTLRSESPMAS